MKKIKESYIRATLSKRNQKAIDEDIKTIKKDMGRAVPTAMAILGVLCTNPKVSIPELVKITGRSKQTIGKIVKILVKKHIMCPLTDKKRYQVYCYRNIIGNAKELFGGDLGTQNKSGVSLNFSGKEAAIIEANTPSKIKFVEDLEHNKLYKNSPNALYVSDNIDCLKYLVKKKCPKFHLIFVDPVYNQKNARQQRQYQDVYDAHSGYLCFMYPRLMLCKQLLADNGLIVITIGEDEFANTKLMCNEIFYEKNFINTIVVECSNVAGVNSGPSKHRLTTTKFYMLVYAGEKSKICSLNRLYELQSKKFDTGYNTIITKDLKHEQLIDYLKKVKWIVKEFAEHDLQMTLTNIDKLMDVSQRFEEYIYKNVAKILYKSTPPFKTYKELAQKQPQNVVFTTNDNRLLIKTKDNKVREFKPFTNRINGNSLQTIRGDLWKGFEKYKNSIAKEGGVEFEGKKSQRLLQDIIFWLNNKKARIMDIGCGSGTTGHATFSQNRKDKGKRSFVMIQIDEPIRVKSKNKEQFKTVDEKTIFRLNNAIKETGTKDGFKIFRAVKS